MKKFSSLNDKVFQHPYGFLGNMNNDNIRPPLIYLKSGELFISDFKNDTPVRVKTILGSCISVTMFHRQLRMAAICHAVLPCYMEQDKGVIYCEEPFRYVNLVIPNMVAKFQKYGIPPREIEVKLFGGADIYTPRTTQQRIQSVGKQNIEMAIEAIKAEHLRLKVADVGGLAGRKIFFYTHTGEVWLKYIKKER